ncbi:MAG: thiamine-phosphate kinase [bacterium]
MLVKDIGEFSLIKRLSNNFTKPKRPVIVGIGDDSAVLNSSGSRLQLVTTDMLVEDVHFRLSTASPFQIGWKSLAANISDIAAMGGEPTYAFISIGLPKDTKVEFVDGVYSGMKAIAEKYFVDVVGGDTVSSPQVIINIALLGEVEPENYKLRSGAKEGDYIFVTGDVGGSSAGLEILERQLPIKGTDKHLMPIPRVKEGRLLAQSGYVTAMIDISDGVSSEINHICEQSGISAKIFMKDIPLSENTRKVASLVGKNPYDYALYGGEDYELLFTCRPYGAGYIKELFTKNCDTHISCIGYITASCQPLTIEDENGVSSLLRPSGYNHFVENQ